MDGAQSLLIALQDNPDPDALAAAVALRQLVRTFGDITCSLASGGHVGRGENRALVQYLGLNLRRMDQLRLEEFSLIAMLDAQPATGNTSLPANRVPDIVIDHHPIRRVTRSARFTDVRRHYGATATILSEYLRESDVQPTVPVATALLYGIRSDTQDLGREATQADISAVEYLFPLANKRMLGQIQRGKVPGAYYQMLADALQRAVQYDHAIVARMGEVDNPDMMGETADLFLRHEVVDWTLSYGLHEGRFLLSLRTSDSSADADAVVRAIVKGIGTGGGHAGFAGGQIPLKKPTADYREKLARKILDRFLRALSLHNTSPEPLVHIDQ
jgi:nanoRNase/pAp phosphatase (c-di-AMP/oligoRNAs hydrolase)